MSTLTFNNLLWSALFSHFDQAVLVLSGGMDSGVLLALLRHLKKEVFCLSFDYQSKHNRQELGCARNLALYYHCNHRQISLPFVNELFSSSLLQSGAAIPLGQYSVETMKQTVVPFRNGIFLAIATGFAESKGISTVLLGSHSGDHAIYPDCRPQFTNAISEAAQSGTYNQVSVLSPFAELNKKQIARIGHHLGFDFRQSYTCYQGESKHCGLCSACLERKIALDFDQGLDPTQYAH